jgi:hypothetical protein
MICSRYLMIGSLGAFIACARQTPVATQTQVEGRIWLGRDSWIRPLGERLAIQFNNEPAIIQVSDGRGGPPITYHGQALMVNRLKAIRSLKAKEARERFGDQTLAGAILIELK